MKYYTLIASLKELSFDGSVDFAGVRESVLEALSGPDRRVVDLFYEWETIAADGGGDFADYYDRVERCGSSFLRGWAAFDRELREGIVRGVWPEGLDRVENILERERGLDLLRWERAGELRGFDVFGLDAVLCYLVRLGVVERWAKVDPVVGREMFDNLVRGLNQSEAEARTNEMQSAPVGSATD